MNLNADTCTSPRLDLGKNKPGNLIPSITGKKKPGNLIPGKKKPGNLIPRSKIDLK